jgi:PRD1 phage membrane DNA delivery
MQGATEAVVTIATAIVGVAILAVLVSQKSNTTGVIQAFGSAFTNALGIAEAPVTGANYQINTSYPASNNSGMGGLQALPQLGLNY